MRHIYLSPHPDDAVLSCGGTIHRHRVAGEAVAVITIFCQDPPRDVSLSSFALLQHEYWGNPPRPLALRRAEDVAALTWLDAEAQHLAFHDAVYRAGADGRWLYDPGTLMGDVHLDDPLSISADVLAECLTNPVWAGEDQVIYAPLGVGRHVDHLVVHAVARRMWTAGYRVAFYEDYPYAERPGAVESALAAAGAESWTEEAISLDVEDLSAKITALRYYASQMSVLFGGAEKMPSRVWAFASTRPDNARLAERIWWPQ